MNFRLFSILINNVSFLLIFLNHFLYFCDILWTKPWTESYEIFLMSSLSFCYNENSSDLSTGAIMLRLLQLIHMIPWQLDRWDYAFVQAFTKRMQAQLQTWILKYLKSSITYLTYASHRNALHCVRTSVLNLCMWDVACSQVCYISNSSVSMRIHCTHGISQEPWPNIFTSSGFSNIWSQNEVFLFMWRNRGKIWRKLGQSMLFHE